MVCVGNTDLKKYRHGLCCPIQGSFKNRQVDGGGSKRTEKEDMIMGYHRYEFMKGEIV